jgi:hypothetical protein
MAGKESVVASKKTCIMPNKKIKQIISIISLLKISKKVTTLGSAMPERCLFVCPGVIIILQINYILFVLPWDLRAFSFWTCADFIEDGTVVHMCTVVHT